MVTRDSLCQCFFDSRASSWTCTGAMPRAPINLLTQICAHIKVWVRWMWWIADIKRFQNLVIYIPHQCLLCKLQNSSHEGKVWNNQSMCTTEKEGTQSLFPVCVTFKPLPSISFPGVWLCTCALRPAQTLFSRSPLGWALHSSRTTTCAETMRLLRENTFVFHRSLTVDNGKSRVAVDSSAFLPAGVESLHLVTEMNIDATSILLCRRMKGMWAAAPVFLKNKDSGSQRRMWLSTREWLYKISEVLFHPLLWT